MQTESSSAKLLHFIQPLPKCVCDRVKIQISMELAFDKV